MQSIVKLTNVYIGSKKQEGVAPNHAIMKRIAKYLTKMLKVFGANEGEQEIGFAVAGAENVGNVSI